MRFRAAWKGPDNALDTLVITSADGIEKFSGAYAYTKSYPSPAMLVAPDVPGSYVIRFITTGGKELAWSDLQVEK